MRWRPLRRAACFLLAGLATTLLLACAVCVRGVASDASRGSISVKQRDQRTGNYWNFYEPASGPGWTVLHSRCTSVRYPPAIPRLAGRYIGRGTLAFESRFGWPARALWTAEQADWGTYRTSGLGTALSLSNGLLLHTRTRPNPQKSILLRDGLIAPSIVIPTGVLPLGLTLNTLLFAAAWWAAVSSVRRHRHASRRRRRKCPSCAYDRRGLTPTTPCPECAAPGPWIIDPSVQYDEREQLPRPRIPERVR